MVTHKNISKYIVCTEILNIYFHHLYDDITLILSKQKIYLGTTLYVGEIKKINIRIQIWQHLESTRPNKRVYIKKTLTTT